MATKKDLVEAYSFSRRRLITAFVSGAPGGREVEPARPGRTVVGGVALSVLLVAGAAIAGVFSPTAPTDWKDPGLIISTDNGAAYVITEESDDPELRPVVNPSTTAALIFGADAAMPTMLSQDTIEDQRIGDDIGILGAPASLPAPDLLIDDGWTACTDDDHGIRVRIDETPDVTPSVGSGVTVESEGKTYVAVPTRSAGGGAFIYRVMPQKSEDGTETDNLLRALNLPVEGEAMHVSQDWLNLFPVGAPLDWSSFDIEDAGEPVSYADLSVGQLITTPEGDDLLITTSGPLALDAFQSAVYQHVLDPDGNLVTSEPGAAPPAESSSESLAANLWPEMLPAEAPPGAPVPCAQLSTEHGEVPAVQLVIPGDLARADDVDEGDKDQVVESDRGAYVLSGGWTDADEGSPYFIDSKGRANPLVGEQTATDLGYGDYPVVVVPDTWVKLFACGVNLSRDAALSPPELDKDPSCDD